SSIIGSGAKGSACGSRRHRRIPVAEEFERSAAQGGSRLAFRRIHDSGRAGASIQVSKQEGHRFRTGASTMVGNLLTLSNGVRALYIEAGWPRTPRDGFIRGGGLAAANIR